MSGPVTDLRTASESFARETVGKHPKAAGLLMAAMFVVILFLVGACAKKGEHFGGIGITEHNNLRGGGLNPIWQHGGIHAGKLGTVDNDYTPTHMAAIYPEMRSGAIHPPLGAPSGVPAWDRQTGGGHEGLAVGGPGGYVREAWPGACAGPCYQTVQGYAADGSPVVMCARTSAGYPATCVDPWDPRAMFEAASLNVTNGIAHPSFAEGPLRAGIASAENPTPASMDDETLAAMVSH